MQPRERAGVALLPADARRLLAVRASPGEGGAAAEREQRARSTRLLDEERRRGRVVDDDEDRDDGEGSVDKQLARRRERR